MTHPINELTEKRRQVCDFLLHQIAGGMRNGDRIWPEHTLSRRLGVSKSTVRRAIRDLVDLGIVRQHQGKGSFVNNADHPRVQAFALHALQLVGFLSPFAHYDDGFMREITLGADQALDHRRFLLMAKHVHLPRVTEADILPGLVAKVQGLLWLSTLNAAARRMIADLHARRFPLVLVDRFPADLPCCCVASDNHEVGLTGTRHLLDLGHRRILHFTLEEDISATLERAEGYRLAMTEAGLSSRILKVSRSDPGHDALAAILGEPPDRRPTALFCLNDGLAIRGCRAAQRLGIAVPGELSVVGVDDDPEAALFDVPLTTVAQPRRQMGFKAARLLEGLMQGTVRTDTRLLLQPGLVVRESSVSPQPGQGSQASPVKRHLAFNQ